MSASRGLSGGHEARSATTSAWRQNETIEIFVNFYAIAAAASSTSSTIVFDSTLRLAMAGIPLIVLLAITLLIYWFRYACKLVLNARIEPDYIARVSAANGLSFLLVRSQLQRGEGSLDALRDALDTDYELLQYLIRH